MNDARLTVNDISCLNETLRDVVIKKMSFSK